MNSKCSNDTPTAEWSPQKTFGLLSRFTTTKKLETLLELQKPLQLIVLTNEWSRWDGSRIEQGMNVKEIVKSDVF